MHDKPLSPRAEALLSWVCDNPGDHEAKLVLADALEEEGNELCEGFRELAKHKNFPSDTGHGWYAQIFVNCSGPYLPTAVVNQLDRKHFSSEWYESSDRTNRDYFLDAAQAYVDAERARRKAERGVTA